MVATGYRFAAGSLVTDIAFDGGKVSPVQAGDLGLNLIQITPMTGREIVEAHNGLIILQKLLTRFDPDKTGRAHDKPASLRISYCRKLIEGGNDFCHFVRSARDLSKSCTKSQVGTMF